MLALIILPVVPREALFPPPPDWRGQDFSPRRRNIVQKVTQGRGRPGSGMTNATPTSNRCPQCAKVPDNRHLRHHCRPLDVCPSTARRLVQTSTPQPRHLQRVQRLTFLSPACLGMACQRPGKAAGCDRHHHELRSNDLASEVQFAGFYYAGTGTHLLGRPCMRGNDAGILSY